MIHVLIRLQSYVLAPVLPLEVKHRAINSIVTGVIMSSYSFSLSLIPPFIKKFLFPRIERSFLS